VNEDGVAQDVASLAVSTPDFCQLLQAFQRAQHRIFLHDERTLERGARPQAFNGLEHLVVRELERRARYIRANGLDALKTKQHFHGRQLAGDDGTGHLHQAVGAVGRELAIPLRHDTLALVVGCNTAGVLEAEVLDVVVVVEHHGAPELSVVGRHRLEVVVVLDL
jgi:hypothetical protein